MGTGKRPGTRHVRIGDTGTHSLAEARQTAARLRAQVQAGGDPKREAEEACERTEAERLTAAKAEAVAAAGRVTADEKLTAYEAVLASRGRSERHQQDELRQVRLALDSAAARGITPADIAVTTVEKMMHSCPAGSRKAQFSALDRFLRWACKGTGAYRDAPVRSPRTAAPPEGAPPRAQDSRRVGRALAGRR